MIQNGALGRLAQLFNNDYKSTLSNTVGLLKAARRGAESIKVDLEKALDLVNDIYSAEGEDRESQIALYRGVVKSIEATTKAAAKNGFSLIDDSDYSVEIAKPTGSWKRSIEHHELNSGKDGLDLPVSDEFGGSFTQDDAQKRIAAAMKKVNRALSSFNSDLDAVQSQADKAGPIKQKKADDEQEDVFLEIVKTVVIALAIAICIRTVLFQPFNIPSGSMKSTLLVGDYLFVSKYSYGYSHKSLPFGVPFFRGRIFERQPERGDVVVFKLPRDGKTDYIKRCVGLPGDKIQMISGVLYINGEAVPKEKAGIFTDINIPANTRKNIQEYVETLPNGVRHITLDEKSFERNDDTGIFVVPDGHYFMMGDNRDNSSDSRVFTSGVGYVPAENLVGRAELIFFSTNQSARLWEIWKWPTTIRYSRLFQKIN